MTGITLRPPPQLRDAGARIPAWTVRVLLVIVAVALTAVDDGPSGWAFVGLALAVLAACLPGYLFAWGLIVFLAAGRLAHEPALDWHTLVLLAGLHLIHGLAMLSLELPSRSWVAPAVFRGPAIRFVAIQIPVQLVAVVALALLAPGHGGHRPLSGAVVAVVGAALLAIIGLLLFGPGVDE